MRLVSQNGMIDVPYEISALSVGCYGRVSTIYIRSKLLDEKPCEFATYSTEEKAVKVMQAVRDAYCSLPVVLKNAEVTDEVIEMLKKKNVICAHTADKDGRIEYINNAVFQFPKDDEVEI